MIVKLLTEHRLEFLRLKGGCTFSPESSLVKMLHCWKSHVSAQMYIIRLWLIVQIYTKSLVISYTVCYIIVNFDNWLPFYKCIWTIQRNIYSFAYGCEDEYLTFKSVSYQIGCQSINLKRFIIFIKYTTFQLKFVRAQGHMDKAFLCSMLLYLL